MDDVDIFIEALRENHDRAEAKNKQQYVLFLEQARKNDKTNSTNYRRVKCVQQSLQN